MRQRIRQIDPVVIMLDGVAAPGPMTFTGVDVEDGSRVRVTLERTFEAAEAVCSHDATPGLVLVLSIETLTARH